LERWGGGKSYLQEVAGQGPSKPGKTFPKDPVGEKKKGFRRKKQEGTGQGRWTSLVGEKGGPTEKEKGRSEKKGPFGGEIDKKPFEKKGGERRRVLLRNLRKGKKETSSRKRHFLQYQKKGGAKKK